MELPPLQLPLAIQAQLQEHPQPQAAQQLGLQVEHQPQQETSNTSAQQTSN